MSACKRLCWFCVLSFAPLLAHCSAAGEPPDPRTVPAEIRIVSADLDLEQGDTEVIRAPVVTTR